MNKITFAKAVASGNDFVVIESLAGAYNLPRLAREICDRKFGVGADGMLLLEKSKKADVRMRIFNADGSEAEMCGNGARCTALYMARKTAKIETGAGIIKSSLNGNSVKIKLTEPKNLKVDIPIKVNGRTLHVNFIDTGVPHTVIFVKDIDEIDVFDIGKKVRYHKNFKPKGTNVDFVEILNNNSVRVRTYERGVEDETLACGTGAVAAALVTSQKLKAKSQKEIKVKTRSGELLKVYFEKINNKFTPLEKAADFSRKLSSLKANGGLIPPLAHSARPVRKEFSNGVKKHSSLTGFTNVWLEGKARIVYKGEYYV